ncbi:MAG: acyltransferase family protein [Janthinobacterium lividum]
MQGSSTPRYDSIDLLRGLSVVAVVLAHCNSVLGSVGYTVGLGLPQWLHDALFTNGGDGVSMFFAISGFLITYISTRRFGTLGQLSLSTFYRTRFARIAPPLLLLLAVLSVLHLANFAPFRIQSPTASLSGMLFAAFTFQLNWYTAVHGFLPGYWTVLWSLSVEEMFYLFFPLLCVALLRKRQTAPAFPIVLICLLVLGHYARSPAYTDNKVWMYQSYLGNIDKIALGCLFALFANHLGSKPRASKASLAYGFSLTGAAVLLLSVIWEPSAVILGHHVPHLLGHTGVDVFATCLIMLGCVLQPKPGTVLGSPLRWFGRHSYEVYLTHEFVVMGALTFFVRTSRELVPLWICVVVALSGLGGYLLARFVSEPMNRILRGARRSPEGSAPRLLSRFTPS